MSDLTDLPFHELIAEADKPLIQTTRASVCAKHQRRRRLNHFTQCLSVLTTFVDSNGETDWKRALLCGLCKCGEVFAVNNTRLHNFTMRSKSSINDLFAKLGYRTVPISQKNQIRIIAKIPFLEFHHDELRQWTYRIREQSSTQLDDDAGDSTVQEPWDEWDD
jgi:hypothetical protein